MIDSVVSGSDSAAAAVNLDGDDGGEWSLIAGGGETVVGAGWITGIPHANDLQNLIKVSI